MKSPNQDVNIILKKQIIKTFAQTVADLNTPKEALTFINDFFDKTELETYSKRLAAAYYLKKGRSSENIKQNLKVENETISFVKKAINTPGIKLAIKKMEAEEWANKWSEKIKKLTK